jgi:hypothetical protein
MAEGSVEVDERGLGYEGADLVFLSEEPDAPIETVAACGFGSVWKVESAGTYGSRCTLRFELQSPLSCKRIEADELWTICKRASLSYDNFRAAVKGLLGHSAEQRGKNTGKIVPENDRPWVRGVKAAMVPSGRPSAHRSNVPVSSVKRVCADRMTPALLEQVSVTRAHRREQARRSHARTPPRTHAQGWLAPACVGPCEPHAVPCGRADTRPPTHAGRDAEPAVALRMRSRPNARDGQPTAVQDDTDSDGDGDESARSPKQPEFVDPECEVPHARRAAAAQPLLMDGRHARPRRPAGRTL